MTKEITLSKGYVALVDDRDYDWLNATTWHAANTNSKNSTHATDKYYAHGYSGWNASRGKVNPPHRMHRDVWFKHNGYINPLMMLDHINGDALDNRIENLRVVTKGANTFGKSKTSRPTTSCYKGVALLKTGKWQAKIQKNRVRFNLLTHDSEWDAAEAYNAAALIHFGEYAKINKRTKELECDYIKPKSSKQASQSPQKEKSPQPEPSGKSSQESLPVKESPTERQTTPTPLQPSVNMVYQPKSIL